ncbi:mandelate racemase/muconate lactonizing enzyme family protein [Puniceibacterium sp. IMCC21224]|uniref:mandelate racemase/muconate lactonizing enzyme family protein n=1 Tax=Puniceibacterium sp. IMCC21224 TaxID=1618204 RepID=UPI00065D93C4|nr:enolase C-terminal domain-like protein [Puniceibacterium sp. IMCC21224]KMK65125.1 enolase superfamily enzyme [Puniceibacterium sp. IMCC21224]
MRIEAWSVAPVTHRNLDPEWHYAGRDVPELLGVRVALRAGDRMGEGYAPFLPHLDTTPEVLETTACSIAAGLLAADLSDLDACVARLGPCSRARNAARSAAEMALLDLAARGAGASVAAMLGGAPRAVEVLRIIPVKSPVRMADIAGSLVAEGYRALKLKGTGDHEADIARIAAVRGAVGAGITLTVDANQAYDTCGALRLERALRPHDIWSLEQPVPANDRASLATVRQQSHARIEADEGLFDADDLDAVLTAEAADGISLKLARSGGLLPSRDMALRGAGRGVYARLGTAFGGPLVTLATATLAALCPTKGPAECAEFAHFDDGDHLWPTVRDGLLIPQKGPGFGQIRQSPWLAEWTG